MTTPAQKSANRLNAKRSTGPRTNLGKARSSLNAYKHGLSAKSVVIAREDVDEFEELRGGLFDQFKPRSAVAAELAELLTKQLWRLRRVSTFEDAVLSARRHEIEAPKKLEELVEVQVKKRLKDVEDDQSRFIAWHPDDPSIKERGVQRLKKWSAEIFGKLEADKYVRTPEDTEELAIRHTGLALIRDAEHHDVLGKLSRYEASLFHAAMKTLERLILITKFDEDTIKD